MSELTLDVSENDFDHVHITQRNFRLILDAFSHPGKSLQLVNDNIDIEISKSIWSILCCLSDKSTNVYFDEYLMSPAFKENIFIFNPCLLIKESKLADFAFIDNKMISLEFLNSLKLGTASSPDENTMLIIDCKDLIQNQEISLSGPGIKNNETITIKKVNEILWDWREKQSSLLNIDIILCDGQNIIALPRTTIIKQFN